jgi:hypothetical protein
MSDDRILQKYSGRISPNDAYAVAMPSEPDGTEDLGAFGWQRGQRDRSVMLELRKRNGDIMAIGYGWIERVEFDRNEGIKLQVCGKTIKIKGKNLNTEARPQVRLFQGITRHRVSWVQEMDQSVILQVEKGTVVIEAIEW